MMKLWENGSELADGGSGKCPVIDFDSDRVEDSGCTTREMVGNKNNTGNTPFAQ
jgi:hypothetical protein